MHYKSLQAQPPLTYEQAELVLQFRELMVRLAYLTRFYIVERITGLGDIDVTRDALARLPIEVNELARTVPGFTGDFTQISLNYIMGLEALLDAMIEGNAAQADESIRQLYRLAHENAAYLAEINPNWDQSTWQDIFSTYIQYLVAQVLAIETGDYNRALDIFDSMVESALERGDYYAAGLVPLLPAEGETIPIAYLNMIKDFRKIFTERTYLTRFYIVSIIVGLGDAEYILQRLNALPGRMREKFELIFGDEIAREIEDLFLLYVVEMERLMGSIVSGDNEQVEVELARSRALGDMIAAYLSNINPYWDEGEWKEIFSSWIDYELQHAYELQSQSYVDAMETFRALMDTSLRAADYLAQGFYSYILINEEEAAQ